MTDFGFFHLATIRNGEQATPPDDWTVVVYYDSKRFYYDVDQSERLNFQAWATDTFLTDGMPDACRIIWR